MSNLMEPFHVESNKDQHARGQSRAGTPGASYERTTREQESQEDIEAILDRQRLRTNHLTSGQRWVPLLVTNNTEQKLRCLFKMLLFLSTSKHLL